MQLDLNLDLDLDLDLDLHHSQDRVRERRARAPGAAQAAGLLIRRGHLVQRLHEHHRHLLCRRRLPASNHLLKAT